MRNDWLIHIQRLTLALFFCYLFGLLIGYPAWLMVAALGAYLAWTLTQAIRLHRWLFAPERPAELPSSQGLWGDLFDGLYKHEAEHQHTQQRLQSLISRVQDSVNALKDVVVMTDSQGNMEWWNQTAENLLGLRTPTDQGQPIQNLVRTPRFKRYFMSKHYDEPLQIRSPHKPDVILSIHITLFGEDDRLILGQDISRLHHLESVRSDFISNVSHELRTPLTVLSGYLETILDHQEDIPPRWKRALHQMQQQSLRMQALVSDLLLLSQLEVHDQAPPQRLLNLELLFDSIKQDAEAFSGGQHQITLHKHTHCMFIGDEAQLRSAFSNLLFNAVKYTPAGGTINIEWWEDELGVHFGVADTGVGFDPVHIPRLTERFYRVDPSRNTQTGGTGLGLAIVKHVLINHEGRLEIQSKPGRGSRFICHFPLSRHQAPKQPLVQP